MKITATALPGVLLVEPAVHADARGYFLESWHAARYREAGMAAFVQGNHAHSRRGTLRGLHFQIVDAQAKLLWVVSGEVLDVAVDVRRGSPTFGRWVGETLSARNHRQLFIPAGFAHGYCVTSPSADVFYLCSAHYRPDADRGVRWSDPAIGIAWPRVEKLLSPKDAALPLLAEAPELPLYAAPSRDDARPAAEGAR